MNRRSTDSRQAVQDRRNLLIDEILSATKSVGLYCADFEDGLRRSSINELETILATLPDHIIPVLSTKQPASSLG